VVEDNGCGISDDVVKRMFEPLFTTKVKGTGLGLAIVSSVVKRHDGKIAVDSQVGRGTRITIDIPPVSRIQRVSSPGGSTDIPLPSDVR
jgi:two-component system NtrC family sensor kinase